MCKDQRENIEIIDKGTFCHMKNIQYAVKPVLRGQLWVKEKVVF